MTERSDLSRPGDGTLPAPLIHIVKYQIKFGKNPVFVRNIQLFGAANDKMDWTGRYFWFVEYGGGGAARTFWRIVPRQHWAAMTGQTGARSSFQAMTETYGEEGLQSWIDGFGESIASLTSEIWRHRPDLSYAP